MATTRVYRAVSHAEHLDILRCGQFLQGPNSLEGKWFADTLSGAHLHGIDLHGPNEYHIYEAQVPNEAPSLFRILNLDAHGPARYLEMDDLKGVRPKWVTKG